MTNHCSSPLLTKLLTLSTLLAIPTLTNAHGYVQGIVATPPNSSPVFYPGYLPSYQWLASVPATAGWADPMNTDNGPITPSNYGSSDIICHRSATPGASSIPVVPGTNLTLQWTPWPTGHLGPVITYIAPCNGPCTSVDKSTLRFTKIDEAGLLTPGQPGTWAAQELVANNNSWTVTIPSDVVDGEYVVRHEIIALHEAMRENGAQNYPQCINVKVSGGRLAARAEGDDVSSGVLGTELYGTNDPGILIDIYNQVNSDYEIPGPKMKAIAAGAGSPVASAASATGSVHVAAVTPAAVANSTVVSGMILSNETVALTVTTATSVDTPIEFALTLEDTTLAFTVASTNQTSAATVAAAEVTTTSTPSALKFGLGVNDTSVAYTVASANDTAMAKLLTATATTTGRNGVTVTGSISVYAAAAETSSVAAVLANETTSALALTTATSDAALIDTSVLPTVVAEASVNSSTQAQYGSTTGTVEGTMYADVSAATEMASNTVAAVQGCAAGLTSFVTVTVTADAARVNEITSTVTTTKAPMPTLSAGLPDSAVASVDASTQEAMPTLSADLPSTFQTVTTAGLVQVINHAPVGLTTEPLSYISPASAATTTTQPAVFAIAATNETTTAATDILPVNATATATSILNTVLESTTAIEAVALTTTSDPVLVATPETTPPAPPASAGVFNIDIDAVVTLTTIINTPRQVYALANDTATPTAATAATATAAAGTGNIQRIAGATPATAGKYQILATGASSAGVAAETGGIVTTEGFIGVPVPEVDNGFRRRRAAKGRKRNARKNRRGAKRAS